MTAATPPGPGDWLEEDVERVARAIYAAETPVRRLISGPDCHDDYRRLATAALSAVRRDGSTT